MYISYLFYFKKKLLLFNRYFWVFDGICRHKLRVEQFLHNKNSFYELTVQLNISNLDENFSSKKADESRLASRHFTCVFKIIIVRIK